MTDSDFHLECRAEEAKLHDRIAELEAENERLREDNGGAHGDCTRLEDTVAELEAENEQLREALYAFGSHQLHCDKHLSGHCKCGFEAALSPQE